MNIEALKNIKINARQLQEHLKETQGKVSYHHCLHVLSKQYGFLCWNGASAYAKENNIEILKAPITNKGAFTNE